MKPHGLTGLRRRRWTHSRRRHEREGRRESKRNANTWRLVLHVVMPFAVSLHLHDAHLLHVRLHALLLFLKAPFI